MEYFDKAVEQDADYDPDPWWGYRIFRWDFYEQEEGNQEEIDELFIENVATAQLQEETATKNGPIPTNEDESQADIDDNTEAEKQIAAENVEGWSAGGWAVKRSAQAIPPQKFVFFMPPSTKGSTDLDNSMGCTVSVTFAVGHVCWPAWLVYS